MPAANPSDADSRVRLAQLATPIRQSPCVCGATDWDDGTVIVAPIVDPIRGPLHFEVTSNDLLWLGVLTCQVCRRTQHIRLMRSSAPTAPQ